MAGKHGLGAWIRESLAAEIERLRPPLQEEQRKTSSLEDALEEIRDVVFLPDRSKGKPLGQVNDIACEALFGEAL